MRLKKDTSNVFIPGPQSAHLSGRRGLAILVLMMLGLIAVSLTWAAADAQERNCGSVYWKSLVYNLRPKLYEKKCGCAHNLDFRFPCNSQYSPL